MATPLNKHVTCPSEEAVKVRCADTYLTRECVYCAGVAPRTADGKAKLGARGRVEVAEARAHEQLQIPAATLLGYASPELNPVTARARRLRRRSGSSACGTTRPPTADPIVIAQHPTARGRVRAAPHAPPRPQAHLSSRTGRTIAPPFADEVFPQDSGRTLGSGGTAAPAIEKGMGLPDTRRQPKHSNWRGTVSASRRVQRDASLAGPWGPGLQRALQLSCRNAVHRKATPPNLWVVPDPASSRRGPVRSQDAAPPSARGRRLHVQSRTAHGHEIPPAVAGRQTTVKVTPRAWFPRRGSAFNTI